MGAYYTGIRKVNYKNATEVKNKQPFLIKILYFIAVMGHFGKDSKHAYFHQRIIRDADSATFRYDEETHKIYDAKGEFNIKNQFAYCNKQKGYPQFFILQLSALYPNGLHDEWA